ncbi:dehydrogenase [Planoprotostelium fungivorum]|uniref:Dehydrogenase n=1 Tax=Planoprotostelium fungivorum TaxID=1890364 RepID=A0A2P6NPQ2_9EUKA|nr:dehydrogenase [Planoprotostelium fungivorum]
MHYKKDPDAKMIPASSYIDRADWNGKTALITGANSGIGLATAKVFACLGLDRLILAVRNREKGEEATNDIIQFAEQHSKRPPHIDIMEIECSDLSSVEAFSCNYSKDLHSTTRPPLDFLILNAGLQLNQRETTVDGNEKTWQVNYLSQVCVVEEWLKSGVITQKTRVVFVSSGMHRLVDRLQLDDIHFQHRTYTFKDAYTQSKLCQLLYMHHLVKLYPSHHFYAVEPGPVKTEIYRKDSGFKECPWEGFEDRPSPDEGAFPILYCCVEDKVKSGGFYAVPDGREGEKSEEARSVEREEELWKLTQRRLKRESR